MSSINVVVLQNSARMSSIDKVVNENSDLSQENYKRHTNTDAALQTICAFMDLIYGQQLDKQYSCCYVTHKKTQIGNFLTCLSHNILNVIPYFAKTSVGQCDVSTKDCGGLANE